ncbi:hypothetical protein D3C81_755680 [compost metagenome]
MSVEIKIFGENAKEALQEIGGLASALVGSTPKKEAAVIAEPTDKPKRSRATTTKPETPAEPDEPEKEEPQTDAGEDDSSEDIPDDVKLRAAAAEAAKTAGKVKVKALLDEYGVPNVTALPDDKRVSFLRDLEGLE